MNKIWIFGVSLCTYFIITQKNWLLRLFIKKLDKSIKDSNKLLQKTKETNDELTGSAISCHCLVIKEIMMIGGSYSAEGSIPPITMSLSLTTWDEWEYLRKMVNPLLEIYSIVQI